MCGVCLATSGDRAATYLMEMDIEDAVLEPSAVSPTRSRGVDANWKSASTCKQRMAHIIASRTRPANFLRRACYTPQEWIGHSRGNRSKWRSAAMTSYLLVYAFGIVTGVVGVLTMIAWVVETRHTDAHR